MMDPSCTSGSPFLVLGGSHSASCLGASPAFTRAVEWWLDLEHIRLGEDAPLGLNWQLPLPTWVIVAVGVLCGLVVVQAYRHEQAGVTRRMALGGVRIALIWLNDGMDIEEVRSRMRHGTLDTTLISLKKKGLLNRKIEVNRRT